MIIELTENNDQVTFKAANEKGEMVEYDVICTFTDERSNKEFIIYTDDSLDQEGNKRIFASLYQTEQDGMILTALETDEDWATVQAVIQKIKEENGIDDNDEVDVDDDIIDIEELSKIMGKITAQTCPDCERDFPFKSDYCPYCGRNVVKKKQKENC